MKLRTICMSMLAIAALTSCNNDDEDHRGGSPQIADANVAYLSIKIATQAQTRASVENQGQNESDLNSLYLITFDDDNKIVGVPGTTSYFTKVDPNSVSPAKPGAVKVSADATRLLVVANPGTKLESAINNISVTSTFNSINTAIMQAAKDEVSDATKGFAMINSGDENKVSNGKLTDLLIDISDKIVKASASTSEAEAEAEAEKDANRVLINIERLAAKLELKVNISSIKPAGADFKFEGWAVDGVNSTFYPCAEKTMLDNTHTGSIYGKTFYTHDPNFQDGTGVEFATLDTDFSLILPQSNIWQGDGALAYCIENTMDAEKQVYGNATRILIKGTYYPAGHTTQTGDWFNFAGHNYMNFGELKTAYDQAAADSDLKKACDDMVTQINTNTNLTIASFNDLTETILNNISNGGEVIKNGDKNVIRWYQNGQCYYYYMIRHNNDISEEMEFGKYGVVRNNWYSLTLGSVNGPGTPWYPDPNNPGPGDPGKEEPIDEAAGYLGITVSTAPWIVWENTIGI